MLAVKGLSMEKWLCWGSLGVAGLVLLLFLLDLFTSFPFQRISTAVDIIGILCCGVLGYLAWNALKDMG
jgi:threonine/homoserine/homoserine lactone efflux protein